MYVSKYQNLVAEKKFKKRFSELEYKERIQINTFIENYSRYKCEKYPESIVIVWDKMLNMPVKRKRFIVNV